MSYNIGQFRRNQLSSYEDKIQVTRENSGAVGVQAITIQTQEGLSFKETALVLKNSLKKGENYYFSFYTSADNSDPGAFIVYLSDSKNEATQPIKYFDVGAGTFCEMVFTPNDINYNKLVFKKVTKTSANDRVYINEVREGNSTFAIYINIELWQLKNIIPLLDVSYIKKLGVQGPPGLMFSMNGEEIHVGKSGIYEVSGLNINTLSFVIKNRSPIPYEDGKDYFIMDYLY